MLKLNFKDQKQWSADGRSENKKKLFYSSHDSVGNTSELLKLVSFDPDLSRKEKLTDNA